MDDELRSGDTVRLLVAIYALDGYTKLNPGAIASVRGGVIDGKVPLKFGKLLFATAEVGKLEKVATGNGGAESAKQEEL